MSLDLNGFVVVDGILTPESISEVCGPALTPSGLDVRLRAACFNFLFAM